MQPENREPKSVKEDESKWDKSIDIIFSQFSSLRESKKCSRLVIFLKNISILEPFFTVNDVVPFIGVLSSPFNIKSILSFLSSIHSPKVPNSKPFGYWISSSSSLLK